MNRQKTSYFTDSACAPDDMHDALDLANGAIGDLRVIECALRTVADEGDPIDEETRQVVLYRTIIGLRRQIDCFEEFLDFIEDHYLGTLAEKE